MHLAYKGAALQMLRDDVPTLFQRVHSMQWYAVLHVAREHGAVV